jgi:hypothetical protein
MGVKEIDSVKEKLDYVRHGPSPWRSMVHLAACCGVVDFAVT